MWCFRSSIVVSALLVSAALAPGKAISNDTASEPVSSSTSPVIVIGFLGGYLPHDAAAHGAVQLAERLRKEYPSGVHVEVFENHRGEKAHQEILRMLDADRDGMLSAAEKRNARIILYGHSWGASETLNVARELEKDGIPVLLTIQIDSVQKRGENDSMIPANVAQAVNFYQTHGIIHGRPEIRAADPARTQIIGNFEYDYTQHPVQCVGYPWFARAFERTHIEIECDPEVSRQVESLIRSKLPQPQLSASQPRPISE